MGQFTCVVKGNERDAKIAARGMGINIVTGWELVGQTTGDVTVKMEAAHRDVSKWFVTDVPRDAPYLPGTLLWYTWKDN